MRQMLPERGISQEAQYKHVTLVSDHHLSPSYTPPESLLFSHRPLPRPFLWTMWLAAAVISLTVAKVLSLPTDSSADNSTSNSTALFPNIVDVSHASPAAAKFFHGYFTAKSLHDADAWLTYFDPNHTFYYDAAVGGGATNWTTWE